MKYRTPDGRQYMADTYSELVDQLWKSSEGAPPTLEEWMLERAQHAEMWHDAKVSLSSPERFIKDLLNAKVIEIVEDSPVE